MQGWATSPAKIMINKLTIFPVLMREEWLFRISVSDESNIMVIVINIKDPSIFFIRFFDSECNAVAFIDEAASGKHLDHF
jgi:hypothetical protein